MSVLINGMKMPKNCTECRFAYDGMCLANWGRKSKIDVTNYCPLVELPAQHGRLIDADALTKMCRQMQSIDWNKKAFPYSWEHAYEEFENDIDEAPTIIGAEENTK